MRRAVYDEWVLRVARATAVLGASVIAVAASCFSKPDKPHLGMSDGREPDGRGSGTGTDGGDVDGDLTSCGTHDDFNTTGSPCGLWGTASNPNYMQRTGTVLQITPQLIGGSAACTTTQSFKFANGTSIEIPMPLDTTMGDHSWFKVSPANNATEFTQVNIMQLGGSGVQVQVTCSGPTSSTMTPYTLSHRFWRLSPQNGGNDVKIENGQFAGSLTSFSGLPTCDWAATNVTMVDVTFGATSGMQAGNTGTFDNFNTNPCPPP